MLAQFQLYTYLIKVLKADLSTPRILRLSHRSVSSRWLLAMWTRLRITVNRANCGLQYYKSINTVCKNTPKTKGEGCVYEVCLYTCFTTTELPEVESGRDAAGAADQAALRCSSGGSTWSCCSLSGGRG